jgi:hypothetical protein
VAVLFLIVVQIHVFESRVTYNVIIVYVAKSSRTLLCDTVIYSWCLSVQLAYSKHIDIVHHKLQSAGNCFVFQLFTVHLKACITMLCFKVNLCSRFVGSL